MVYETNEDSSSIMIVSLNYELSNATSLSNKFSTTTRLKFQLTEITLVLNHITDVLGVVVLFGTVEQGSLSLEQQEWDVLPS